jgi:hypothetical protein
MAAIAAHLGPRFLEEPARSKVVRWFWCGVFGEVYGGTTETRFAKDIVDVLAWIDGGDERRQAHHRPRLQLLAHAPVDLRNVTARPTRTRWASSCNKARATPCDFHQDVRRKRSRESCVRGIMRT